MSGLGCDAGTLEQLNLYAYLLSASSAGKCRFVLRMLRSRDAQCNGEQSDRLRNCNAAQKMTLFSCLCGR